MKKETQIDYYGTEHNYIHLKFGDCLKAYNFTEDFRVKYRVFVKAYENYWNGKNGNKFADFQNPFQIINYAYNNKIPVKFYYNFTDTPAKNRKEIIEYLLVENDISTLLDNK